MSKFQWASSILRVCFALSVTSFTSIGVINPILPGIWKDVVTWGGIMAPPCFLGFEAAKTPTLNLGTFLALKNTYWEDGI